MLDGTEFDNVNNDFDVNTSRFEETARASNRGARVHPLGFIDGFQTQRKIRITYDRTKDLLLGAVGAIPLGITLPRNAVIKKAWVDCPIPPTSGGSATLALHLVGANDILSALAIASFTGIFDCIQTGLSTNMIKLTAPKELILTVAVDTLLTGKFHVFMEYDISDPA